MSAARPLAEHGTTARAQGRRSGAAPCPCVPCITARRHYQNRRQALRSLGHPGIVPAARAARHLRDLAEAGLTWRQITTATGISQGTLANLLRPDAFERTINISTQQRILAAALPPSTVPGEHRVDGAGTRRRLRALQRIGWSCGALARQCPLTEARLNKALRAARVSVGTRSAVAALFARLQCTPGPSLPCARRAEGKGWAPPAAWDDESIDDPDAAPNLGRRVSRAAAVAQDAQFIRRTTGADDALIAARLGLSRDGLRRALERADRAREQAAA